MILLNPLALDFQIKTNTKQLMLEVKTHQTHGNILEWLEKVQNYRIMEILHNHIDM